MNSNQFNSQSRKQGLLSILNTQPTTITTRTKSTGPYDRNFLQNLIDHGVYPEEYEYPDGRDPPAPNNWEEINQRLAQPRPSLSPFLCPEETFKKFNRANKHASKENRVTDSVIPIIEGEIRDGRCVSGGIPLTNLDHLTDGALSSGNPDRYYGARPEQLNPKIRDQLSGTIVPSTQTDLPIAPSFFLATKGPDGSVSVARRQACYDGALGARGIQSLQSYGHAEPVYDNNAYTITSTYYDGQLKLYTSFPVQPANPGGRPEYYMKQLKAYAMTCDSGVFRQGVAAYRNARDWAKEKRDALIEAANGKFSGTCNRSQSLESSGYKRAFTSSAKAVSMESDTSADELVLDAEQMYSSFSKRPRREVSESNRESGGSI
ncbi:hypothetical protein MMC17_000834 [Xylographa soralifera]|nr:hypothetical protein [Xylographa soralifera]